MLYRDANQWNALQANVRNCDFKNFKIKIKSIFYKYIMIIVVLLRSCHVDWKS